MSERISFEVRGRSDWPAKIVSVLANQDQIEDSIRQQIEAAEGKVDGKIGLVLPRWSGLHEIGSVDKENQEVVVLPGSSGRRGRKAERDIFCGVVEEVMDDLGVTMSDPYQLFRGGGLLYEEFSPSLPDEMGRTVTLVRITEGLSRRSGGAKKIEGTTNVTWGIDVDAPRRPLGDSLRRLRARLPL